MLSLSKMVNNRKVTGERVGLAMDCHGPECIPAADAKINAGNDVSEPVTLQPLFGAMKQLLSNANEAIVRSDLDVAQEAADDPQFRLLRDDATGEIIEINSNVKKSISGAYGDAILSEYGFAGELPLNPDQMVTYGKNVVELLRAKPFTRALKPGLAALDPQSIAAVIESSVLKLENALGNIKTEEKELEFAVRERTRAIAEWQETYIFVATIVSAVFRFAGRADLADRVRPSSKRESGAEEGPPVEATPQTQSASA